MSQTPKLDLVKVFTIFSNTVNVYFKINCLRNEIINV